jgi:hypothetical protein
MRGYSRSMLVYIRLRRKKGNSWLEKFSEKVQFRNSISFELVPELGKIYRIYINVVHGEINTYVQQISC